MNVMKLMSIPGAIHSAETTLINLGALYKSSTPEKSDLTGLSKKVDRDAELNTITPLGKALTNFPVAPRFAKMYAYLSFLYDSFE